MHLPFFEFLNPDCTDFQLGDLRDGIEGRVRQDIDRTLHKMERDEENTPAYPESQSGFYTNLSPSRNDLHRLALLDSQFHRVKGIDLHISLLGLLLKGRRNTGHRPRMIMEAHSSRGQPKGEFSVDLLCRLFERNGEK